MPTTRTRILFIAACLLLASLTLHAYDRKNFYSTIRSFQSYRHFVRGVKFYHQERFNASADSFRLSLNDDPTDEITRYWYGKALYKGGNKDAGLNEWINIERMGLANQTLKARIARLSSSIVDAPMKDALENFVYLKAFSDNEILNKYLIQPIDVIVDDRNMLYILDFGDNAIKVFNANGHYVRAIKNETIATFINKTPIKMKAPVPFFHPRSITFDNAYNLYIADTGNDVVYKLTREGKLLLTIGSNGYGKGEFFGPTSVAVDSVGKIYVTDTGNNRVQIFAPTGEHLLSFGMLGDGEGEFFRPTGVAVGETMRDGTREKSIYVADTGNMRIVAFNEYGDYRYTISNEADKSFLHADREASIENEGYTLFHPRYIKPAHDGNFFISDETRVFYFNASNITLTPFTYSRTHTKAPMGIAQGRDNLLYAVDFVEGGVDVFLRKEHYYANLEVTLDRVILSAYPTVVAKVSVRDRTGKPITGLTPQNFSVDQPEVDIPVVDFYTDSKEFSQHRFIFIIEDSAAMRAHEEAVKDEINGFVNTLQGDDEVLVIHFNDRMNVQGGFKVRNARIRQSAFDFSFQGGTKDLSYAIYEAVRNGLATFKRTGIIIFTTGNVTEASFTYHSLEECFLYAKNNFIPISVVNVGETQDNYFLSELAKGAYGRYLDGGKHIAYADEMDHLKTVPLGLYYLVFNVVPLIRKERYQPLTVQVNYKDMIGEENAGYLRP